MKRFEVSALNERDQLRRLLELGLDFSDGKGEALRCMPYFARAAEAAAKRSKGFDTKMPTLEEVSVSSFGERMQEEAQAVMRAKKGSPHPRPKD